MINILHKCRFSFLWGKCARVVYLLGHVTRLFLLCLSHYAYLGLFGVSTGKLFILNLFRAEVRRNLRSSQAHDAEAFRVILLQLLDGARYMHDNKLSICLLLLLGGEHLQRENTFDVDLGVPKAQCSV